MHGTKAIARRALVLPGDAPVVDPALPLDRSDAAEAPESLVGVDAARITAAD